MTKFQSQISECVPVICSTLNSRFYQLQGSLIVTVVQLFQISNIKENVRCYIRVICVFNFVVQDIETYKMYFVFSGLKMSVPHIPTLSCVPCLKTTNRLNILHLYFVCYVLSYYKWYIHCAQYKDVVLCLWCGVFVLCLCCVCVVFVVCLCCVCVCVCVVLCCVCVMFVLWLC